MHGHLIHIGFPKTGSTFLQEWFGQHPGFFYTPGGLGGFFNIYEVSRMASQNTKDFMYFVTSDESLSTPVFSTGTIPIEYGMKNITSFKPDRLAQIKVCQILKCLYPKAKILFITRSFKGIIMSGYSQYIRVGGVRVFEEFAGESSSALRNQADKNNDGGGLDYSIIANMYEEAFDKENVIILPFELLRDNENKFLATIEKRLGITHFEVKITRQNESLSPEELYWYPRISSLVSNISQRFGLHVYTKVYRWYVGKTLKNKFHKFIKVLSWLKPNRRVTEANFHADIWDYFRENYAERFAGKFRDDPFYKPYLKEYLIDGERR